VKAINAIIALSFKNQNKPMKDTGANVKLVPTPRWVLGKVPGCPAESAPM